MFWRYRRTTMSEHNAGELAVSANIISNNNNLIKTYKKTQRNQNNQQKSQKQQQKAQQTAAVNNKKTESKCKNLFKNSSNTEMNEMQLFPIFKINTGLEIKGIDISKDGKLLACVCNDDAEEHQGSELHLYYANHSYTNYICVYACVCVCECLHILRKKLVFVWFDNTTIFNSCFVNFFLIQNEQRGLYNLKKRGPNHF